MKKSWLVPCLLFLLNACSKQSDNGPEVIVEPPYPYAIKMDTITMGGLWNLVTGSSKKQVYDSIQKEQHIRYLAITGYIPTALTDIQNRFELYTTLLLDENKGTASGIQFYFENDKIKSIYLNDGTRLNRWPLSGNVAIQTGAAVQGIYDQLTAIQKNPLFSKKFERISLFSKNIQKPFDDRNMEISNRWELSSNSKGPKTIYTATLVFTNDKLDSIYTRQEQYH